MQTPTTQPQAADLQAAIKKTLHSAAFAKFMVLAVQTALAETQTHPQGLVLAPPGKRQSTVDGQCLYCVTHDEQGRTIGSFQWHEEKRKWFGCEHRYDADGHQWERYFPNMVHDDFGNLVEVPA